MTPELSERLSSALVRSGDVTRALKTILLTAVVGALAAGVVAYIVGDHAGLTVCGAVLLVSPFIWWLARNERPTLASVTLVLSFNAIAVYACATGAGIRDPALCIFPVVIITSGILLVRRLALLTSAVVVASGVALGATEVLGLLRTRLDDPTELSDVINIGIILVIASILIDILASAVRASITRAALLQEQVRESEKLRAVGLLARGVAHDFNNQLTGILANASLLELVLPKDSDGTKFLKAIVECSHRSADLTRQLLAFARKGRHRNVHVDIDELVKDVTVLLSRSIDKRITITHGRSPEPATVQGDPSFLQNALLNLALNACDAMPSGGVLRFMVDVIVESPGAQTPAASERSVRVRVQDTGVGMTAEIAAQVFEPFFTTKENGNGMGLAAVQGTIQAHDGSIHVDSELGNGTTFTVTLPLSDRATASAAARTPTSPPRFDSLRVLVADDEEAVARVAKTLLEKLGCEVVVCHDGTRALAELADGSDRFDLALLDYSMPGLSGRDVLKALRERDCHVPVISTSGYAMTRELQGGSQYQPGAFLAKPFDIANLTHAIEQVVERHDRGVAQPRTTPVHAE